MKKYKFRKYSKKFAKLFEKEKAKLEEILPKNSKIEHIGSTSVQTLRGKGIIDILVVVNKKNMGNTKKILLQQSYKPVEKASDIDRLFFKKTYRSFLKSRRVHIHVSFKGSKSTKEVINFRNNLRKNKELQEEYGNIKKNAVQTARGDGKIYRKLKESFMKKYSK